LFQLNARQAGHGDPEIASFYSDLQNQFGKIPGVRDVSLSHRSMIHAGTGLPISVSGVETNDTRLLFIGPRFFTTLQIPMRLGRDLEERDQSGSHAVAVVSESFAKANFADENPLGRSITLGGRNITPVDMEIVGVSREARYGGVKRNVPPVVYLPYYLQPASYPVEQMVYELRTAGDPLAYVNSIREIVKRADSRVPVTNVETQVAEIDQTINQEITFAKLCTAFAILALLIACVGLYGTMSYAVARRTGEIGIRMALGAQRGGVIWMVLRQVFVLAIAGLAIGLPVALATSKLVESFLFGMKPDDPVAITAAVSVLIAAAVIAGYAPARRASKIDPMVALRHE
jgi:predicted permease